MLILLPPSEGKTPASDDREPVDFSLLRYQELNVARKEVLETLIQLSRQDDALELLKIGKSLVGEVERNQRLFEEAAVDASSIYSGVLYEALDYQSLTRSQQIAADQHIVIISALWGMVHLDDVIPAYRLSMGTKLGRLGALPRYWKPQLMKVLNQNYGQELIIDCRSADYLKALPTPAENTYLIKPVAVNDDGSRKVISHSAKHYRGIFTRWIVQQNLVEIQDIESLTQAMNDHWDFELLEPQGNKSGAITLLIS